MLGIVSLLSCVGAVLCGGIGSPLLALDGGVAARTSIAYGNTAFLSRFGLASPYAGAAVAGPYTAHLAHEAVAAPIAAVHEGVIAQPLTAHAPVVAAHAAIAAPVARLATPFVAAAPAISSVHHVPAVAQVPVTKYEAQPAFLQNVVHVANPKVATRKFEIRRPAIQKEFYDIEERVVVRPAGSAVVELDQPISKNQRGPTVVRPAAPVAAVRALPIAHSLHAHAIFPGLQAIPVHSYPVHESSIQQPIIPPTGEAPTAPQPSEPSPTRPDVPAQPQFDDNDSVSIENPELGRSNFAQQQQQQEQQITGELRSLQIQRLLEEQSRAQADFRTQQQQRQDTSELRTLQIQRLLDEQTRTQAELKAQQDFQTRARQQAQQQLIEQQQFIEQQQVEQARLRSQQATQASQRQSIAPAPAPVRENVEVRSHGDDIRISDITRELTRNSQHQLQEIPSVRSHPEVEISNQDRLLALLTERGSVSEIRSSSNLNGGSLEGSVRARVLSVTPAPTNASPRDEKVNTRRVVVNRPIQTVQEVDVVEPFTKFERITVNQPAVIKTARLGVANVATSLPVHTYTHGHYVL